MSTQTSKIMVRHNKHVIQLVTNVTTVGQLAGTDAISNIDIINIGQKY